MTNFWVTMKERVYFSMTYKKFALIYMQRTFNYIFSYLNVWIARSQAKQFGFKNILNHSELVSDYNLMVVEKHVLLIKLLKDYIFNCITYIIIIKITTNISYLLICILFFKSTTVRRTMTSVITVNGSRRFMEY